MAEANEFVAAMTDKMAFSDLPEIQTLRRTLMRWRGEILAYFASGLTNGRTEGFNNKAKVVKVWELPKLSAATSKRVCLKSFLRLPTAN